MNYKVIYCWWPRRLAKHEGNGFHYVGWVWRTRAFLVKNDNYGWIAFVGDQTPEKLASICPCCHRSEYTQKESVSVEDLANLRRYVALRRMHWSDKRLVVVSANSVDAGVQCYAGFGLDEKIDGMTVTPEDQGVLR